MTHAKKQASKGSYNGIYRMDWIYRMDRMDRGFRPDWIYRMDRIHRMDRMDRSFRPNWIYRTNRTTRSYWCKFNSYWLYS